MTDKPKSTPAPAKPLKEGYQPVKKGWAPKVQGGFKPGANVATSPPKGGSGVKPSPSSKK
jgi:hypothetical protein